MRKSGEGSGGVGSRASGSAGVAIGPLGCNLCVSGSQVQSPGGTEAHSVQQQTCTPHPPTPALSNQMDTSNIHRNNNRKDRVYLSGKSCVYIYMSQSRHLPKHQSEFWLLSYCCVSCSTAEPSCCKLRCWSHK